MNASDWKVDRNGWPAGPWDEEGDFAQFEHAGVACQLLRTHLGAWCGYVSVPEGHPLYGAHYDDVNVDVHGGLTYGDTSKFKGPGWWFGFDCSHFGDLIPYLAGRITGAEYRTVAFAEKETRRLAEQIQDLHAEAARHG